MAEDETDFQDIKEESEDVVVRKIIKKEDKQKRKPCNSRIDQLATPNRRFLKLRLQKLYSMTPENTEQYVAKLQDEAKRRAWRKMMNDKLKKLVAQKKKIQYRRKAYCFPKKLLKRAMKRAYNYESSVLVPVRLRLVSDVILKQLCNLPGFSKKLLKQAMKRAFKYDSSVLVPVRLRVVSDIIQKKLNDLRGSRQDSLRCHRVSSKSR